MKTRRKLMSLITIVGLFVFAFACAGDKPGPSASAFAGFDYEDFSAVASTYSTYIAEVKRNAPGPGGLNQASRNADLVSTPNKFGESHRFHSRMCANTPRSLWLLHRSILI